MKPRSEPLIDQIEKNINKTREIQEEWLQAIREVDKSALFKEAFTPHSASQFEHTYQISDDRSCKICVAAGDMTQMHNIDVLVNTENSDMQMARNFETKTLSAKLRARGSRISRAGFVVEDSVQQALYDQISKSDDFRLPINLGFVVPTHAGHRIQRTCQTGYALYHACGSGTGRSPAK